MSRPFMKRYLQLVVNVIFILSSVSLGAAEKKICVEGSKDENGNLVIYCFDSASPAVLTTDYGVVMYRDDKCMPKFILADRKAGSSKTFESYDEFTDVLGTLSKGSLLHVYDRCTVPHFYDFYPLHEELMEKFLKDARRVHVKVSKEPVIICTCKGESGLTNQQTV